MSSPNVKIFLDVCYTDQAFQLNKPKPKVSKNESSHLSAKQLTSNSKIPSLIDIILSSVLTFLKVKESVEMYVLI